MAGSPPLLLGGFRLDEEIGRGGMGGVYRGVHRSSGVPVAIKIIGATLAGDDAFRAAFRDEVRAVAALDHPGIVMVFDQGEVSAEAASLSGGAIVAGAPYFVMELLAHGTLHDVPAGLAWPWLRAVLLGLLDALAHAHARGVVHRDIKPGNVLLGARAGMIKLTDFGIAHRLDEHATAMRHGLTGTPHYMAPEQIDGALHTLGPWTDLYAVGCLAYRLAGGRPPFWEPRISVQETLRRHQTAPVPPLQSRRPVPPGFGAWLRGMLAKSPALRFRSAADAVAALIDLGEAAPAAPEDAAPESASDEPTRLLAVAIEGTARRESGEAAGASAGAARLEGAGLRPPAFPATWRAAQAPARSPALAGAGLGLFALRPAPFVGRDRERDALWAALGAVHAGRAPRVVLLRGAAGVGKTRLGDWLSTRAREVGAASVLRALHAAAPGAGEGLGPMAARFLRTAGLSRPEAAPVTEAAVTLLRGGPADAAPLLEVTHPLADGDDDGTARVRFAGAKERRRALSRLVELLGRDRPVLIHVEDAQWAPDALAFVEEILAAGLPALCLLGISEDALHERPAEAEALAALAARGDAETLALTPLDEGHHGELVRGLLGLAPELSAQVAARTHGNPLFAVQLVGDWVQRGLLEVGEGGFALAAGAAADVPADIHGLWLRRVTRAVETEPAVAVVELAAILGGVVSAAEWTRAAAAAGLPAPADLAPALELHGLIRRDGPAWAFCHGMLVESLRRHARAAGRWEAHHRAAARALGTGPGGTGPGIAERVAGHLEAAGDLDAALAPALAAAWERHEASDYAGALAVLDRRDRWLDRLALPDADPRRAWGWIRRAVVLSRMANVRDAGPFVDRAEAAARAHGHDDLLAEALHAGAKNAQMAGRATDSIALFEEARAHFAAAGDRRGTARCDHGVAEMLKQSSRRDEAGPRYHAALAAYADSGDRTGHASCLLGLAHLELDTHHPGGPARMAEAERELGAVGNRLGQAVAALVRGNVARGAGSLDEAEALYERSAAVLAAVGSADVTVVKHNVGQLHLLRGDFARATAILEEVFAEFSKAGREGYLVFAHVALLPCRAAARDWPSFDGHCTAAEALLARTGLTDEDMATGARLAASLAQEAGEETRAARAAAIARAQEAGLGEG